MKIALPQQAKQNALYSREMSFAKEAVLAYHGYLTLRTAQAETDSLPYARIAVRCSNQQHIGIDCQILLIISLP